MLIYQVDSAIRGEDVFVLDFSKQEKIEEKLKEEAFKEDISRKIDELIAASRMSGGPIRNIAVDAGSKLKDDRNTDAEQLYKDAERLANELKAGKALEDARDETVELPSQNKKEDPKKKEYSGPSVVSYSLDGRKASHLNIPAYKCYGSGDVTVIITVNNSGKVTSAKVLDEVSSSDRCLQEFAVLAASKSRFSVSTTAPHNQKGEILYRFIAQ